EVLILLAKSPRDNAQALLSLAQDRITRVRWLAVCNLLTEIKEPKFAALLLKDLKIDASVVVSEDGNVGVGEGSSWVACGGGAAFSVPDDYPPAALYTLTQYATRGAVVAAPGKHAIYYERRVVQPGLRNQVSVGGGDSGGDKDERRAEYLAALLDTSVEGL